VAEQLQRSGYAAEGHRPDPRGVSLPLRVAMLPPNFLTIAFGIAGLGLVWRASMQVLDVPGAVADTLFGLAAAVWAVLVAGMLMRLARTPEALAREISDPMLSPYLSVPPITALLLAGGLFPHAQTPGRVVALIAVAATVLLGGWLTGQWIAGALDPDGVHPGYFLPTVAGGFVAANVMAVMGYRTIAWLCFGIGVICWMQLGSLILNRLFLGPRMTTALVPTLAIEVAPPAVGGNAYFALHRGADDLVMYAFAGFCVLSVVVQLRFVPVFRSLPFAASFWGFTFSYTAVATFALNWIAHERADQARLLAWIVLVVITAFVGAIAAKSVRAMVRGHFFPVVEPGSA
jgi:tellurite resistance protein